VTSYLVGQRAHEIGLRMALGAGRREVLGLVLRQGARTALLGAALGMLAAAGLTRLLGHLLYGVGAADPPTFLGVAAILLAVTLVACWLPASRAAGIDPASALRRE
jgi:putative ABC transport system permease protein